ncbi:helix-turn-helix domain-containing protein [Halomarina halobia]|uniref:Helix-turn-helix domain-containing protein n=1 Tax=Halomarina halobia TaxID=3033386 RepID=A0ABD6A755_9EURY|nr:helix-turn-helix domain-containing protein [Halomarina sp. PSR21]
MSTLVEVRISVDEFALGATLQRVTEARFVCERTVHTDETMPLVWARAPDRVALETALDSDATVERWSRLSTAGDEWLYRIEWDYDTRLVFRILAASPPVVLTAQASRHGWSLRLLYPEREMIERTLSFCDEMDISLDVVQIQDVSNRPVGSHGLTDEQYDALVTAAERGYFDVPRAVTLEDLADELGVSHQALSERLRRGNSVLVDKLLQHGTAFE